MNESELNKIKMQFRAAGAVAGMVICVGAVFYHLVEKLSWLDAFYFSVITLATVGYGDITPHTSIGKLFTMFYVIVGIGIIGTFANLLLRRAATKRAYTKAKK